MERVQPFQPRDRGREGAGQVVVIDGQLDHVAVGVGQYTVPLGHRPVAFPEVALDPVGPAHRLVKLDQGLPFRCSIRRPQLGRDHVGATQGGTRVGEVVHVDNGIAVGLVEAVAAHIAPIRQ